MKLIVGLGNPGKEYAKTRHNIGWMLLDVLAEQWSATPFRSQPTFQAHIAEVHIGGEKILLVKPSTYMNNSGQAVQALLSYYKMTPQDLLVLQDEMDYALGTFAFAPSGGAGGHNGIRSIHTQLGTKEIARLRLGISRPTGPILAQDYVLQTFSEEEGAMLPKTLLSAAEAIKDWFSKGLTGAMNSWNGVKHEVDQRTGSTPRLPPTSGHRQSPPASA